MNPSGAPIAAIVASVCCPCFSIFAYRGGVSGDPRREKVRALEGLDQGERRGVPRLRSRRDHRVLVAPAMISSGSPVGADPQSTLASRLARFRRSKGGEARQGRSAFPGVTVVQERRKAWKLVEGPPPRPSLLPSGCGFPMSSGPCRAPARVCSLR